MINPFVCVWIHTEHTAPFLVHGTLTQAYIFQRRKFEQLQMSPWDRNRTQTGQKNWWLPKLNVRTGRMIFQKGQLKHLKQCYLKSFSLCFVLFLHFGPIQWVCSHVENPSTIRHTGDLLGSQFQHKRPFTFLMWKNPRIPCQWDGRIGSCPHYAVARREHADWAGPDNMFIIGSRDW